MKNIKLFSFELVSTLLLFGISPIAIINFFCLIGLLIKRSSFQYPFLINMILLCFLLLCFILSIFLLLFKRKKLIFENNVIKYDEQIIRINQIKSIKYFNMNIFLLPILYFYKNGNGLIMSIKYIDDNEYNKEVNFRVTKKQLKLISSALPQNLEIKFK